MSADGPIWPSCGEANKTDQPSYGAGRGLVAGLATSTGAQTPPPGTGGTLPTGLPQPTETIDLWPNGAPGMPSKPLIETVNERSTDAQLTDRAVQE